MSNFTKLMAQAAAGAAGGGDFYPYTVDSSARIDSGSYLARTPSTSGNQKTWTLSFWLKKFATNVNKSIFGAGSGTGNNGTSIVNTTDSLYFATADGTSSPWYYVGFYELLRDTSAWYHIVVQLDTTQATNTERQKIWVNGVRLSNYQYTNYIAQNTNGYVNSASYTHYIGYNANYSSGANGYLADMIFLDGQALDPTSFGESKNGVWIPKDLSAQSFTFGTNGFWLDFADSSNLGNDVSGNNNDFTSSGLTSSDQMPDTPTNNFATLNPLLQFPYPAGYYGAMYNGNLEKEGAASNSYTGSYSTIAMPPNTGKWYSEHYVQVENRNAFGISYALDAGFSAPNYEAVYGYYLFCYSGWGYSNLYATEGNLVEQVTNLSAGEIVSILYDSDNSEVTFFVNGTQAGSTMSVPSATYLFFADGYGVSPKAYNVSNFGQDSTFGGRITAGGNTDANGLGDFKYTVPTDALALCTANLPEPTIGPNSDTLSDENFNTVLYTGNGSTQSVTGVNYQPDITWIKDRGTTYGHQLFDVLRGAENTLRPDADLAEYNQGAQYGGLTSFDSDGFSVDVGTDVDVVNTTGNDYVSWNWKANGSGVSNTDGATASTVSVNTDAGISIVTYTGTGSVTTVGHGLGVTPNFIIVKARDQGTGYNWSTYSSMLGPTYNTGALDNANAADASYNYWANTAPTSSVFTVSLFGAVNDNGGRMLAYCFAEVEDFSSFGSYTGNGSNDGPFVYTGFRPAFVIMKRTDSAGAWHVFDNKRSGYNKANDVLQAHDGTAELSGQTYEFVDLLSNGFKVRRATYGPNVSGGTYIYIAFAENPFKYANAR